MSVPRYDAIVFAGGRGTRLGGIDKAALIVDHVRLVDRVVAAARTVGATTVVVAGPAHVGTRADLVVQENPPFGGPLAALGAALASMNAPRVLLLACDLAHPAEVAEQLVHAANEADGINEADGTDGVILCDETGHRQWLASLIDTTALRRGIREVVRREGTLEGGALVSVFRELTLRDVVARPGSTQDIDTPEQLAAHLSELAAGRDEIEREGTESDATPEIG